MEHIRMLSLIDSAVAGAAPFLPVRLVVFPESAHAVPVFVTAAELLEKMPDLFRTGLLLSFPETKNKSGRGQAQRAPAQ